MKSDRTQLMTRPYLGRADGFLTLQTSTARRGGAAGAIGPGAAIVMILLLSAAAGIVGIIA